METPLDEPSATPVWFHVSQRIWQPGHQIPAGRFGEFLRMNGGTAEQRNNMWWELGLETARHILNLQPSRLNCVFVVETIEEAIAFRDQFRGGVARIYRVSPVDPDVVTFRGDFALLAAMQSTLDELPERARRYWTEQERRTPELLVGGPVVVRDEVLIAG